jgi:AraC-like DNA-binding protein
MSDEIVKKKEGFHGQKAIVLPRNILQSRCVKNDIINPLYVTDIGFYPNAKHHYRERPHGADQHILIYCKEGKGFVKINQTEYSIKPGDFIVIPIKTPHTYFADKVNPWSIYWVHFKGNNSSQIVSFLEKKHGFKDSIRYDEKSLELFNEIYNELERGYGTDSLIYSNMCLWHFLTTFLFNERHGNIGEIASKDSIDIAIDYLSNNIVQTLTVENIAGQVNLSPNYFSTLFKNKTGFTPIEYFNHLKVQKACQYLLFTSLRIKEISLEIGIDDQFYFSRLFTKVMGMSPQEYREKKAH